MTLIGRNSSLGCLMSNAKFEVVSIYQEWGFTSSPFQTTALPASDVGAQLITGRDKELQRLIKLIVGYPKMPTVEGLNGVGKTSIVKTVSQHCFTRF